MWKLTNHFALGYLMGGIAVSFVDCFLLRNDHFAFWQFCAGYIVTCCLCGVMFGGASKILGYPQASAADGPLALISGAACTFVAFGVHIGIQSFQVDRIFLFALPIAAAVVYTLRARREWRRRVLTGVDLALTRESEQAEDASGVPN